MQPAQGGEKDGGGGTLFAEHFVEEADAVVDAAGEGAEDEEVDVVCLYRRGGCCSTGSRVCLRASICALSCARKNICVVPTTPTRSQKRAHIIVQLTQGICPIDGRITYRSAFLELTPPRVVTVHPVLTAETQCNQRLGGFGHCFAEIGAVLVWVAGYGDAAGVVEVADGGVDGVEIAVDVSGELEGVSVSGA